MSCMGMRRIFFNDARAAVLRWVMRLGRTLIAYAWHWHWHGIGIGVGIGIGMKQYYYQNML